MSMRILLHCPVFAFGGAKDSLMRCERVHVCGCALCSVVSLFQQNIAVIRVVLLLVISILSEWRGWRRS